MSFSGDLPSARRVEEESWRIKGWGVWGRVKARGANTNTLKRIGRRFFVTNIKQDSWSLVETTLRAGCQLDGS